MSRKEEILDGLYEHTLEGEAKPVVELTKEGLELGMDPLELLFDALIPALEEVGRLFEIGEYFVPEMLIAARAMQGAMDILKPLIAETGAKPTGTFVMGTVKGDIHDIGKNILASLYKAHGYKVVDLGKDVSAATFIESAEGNGADVIAASALMSITRAGAREVADLLRELNLADKYILLVGGGSIDQPYADEIGADGYSFTASGAVELTKTLLAARKGA